MDLKTYLQISNRTQAEFATACGVTPGRISHLVAIPDATPSLSLARRIRDASDGAVSLESWEKPAKAA